MSMFYSSIFIRFRLGTKVGIIWISFHFFDLYFASQRKEAPFDTSFQTIWATSSSLF